MYRVIIEGVCRNWILIVSVLVAFCYRTGIIELLDERIEGVVVMDVGQGDAILVSSDRNFALIDGGPDDRVIYRIENYFHPWEREIDLLVLTHPHKDHIEGLFDVLERFDVLEIWVNAVCYESSAWEYLLNDFSVDQVNFGDEKYIGSFVITVINPIEYKKSNWDCSDGGIGYFRNFDRNINNDSIVLGVSRAGVASSPELLRQYYYDYLLMGDAEVEIEDELIRKMPDLRAAVLKAGHHCSKTSSSEKFLRKVSPEVAICSCGSENKFGHPSPETIGRFRNLLIEYYLTYEEGDIVIEL